MDPKQVKRGMKVEIDYTDLHAPRCSYKGLGRVIRKAGTEYGANCFECLITGGKGVFDANNMKEVKE